MVLLEFGYVRASFCPNQLLTINHFFVPISNKSAKFNSLYFFLNSGSVGDSVGAQPTVIDESYADAKSGGRVQGGTYQGGNTHHRQQPMSSSSYGGYNSYSSYQRGKNQFRGGKERCLRMLPSFFPSPFWCTIFVGRAPLYFG